MKYSIAQRRGFFENLLEKYNPVGVATEIYYGLEDEMDILRSVDDYIRSKISGDSDSHSAKKLLDLAQTAINRREYMNAISILGQFEQLMTDISDKLKHQVKEPTDEIHEKFLFKYLDDDQKNMLRNLKERFASHPSKVDDFIKYAGLIDFFSNLFTEKGRALAAWEKRFPKKVAELKSAVQDLYKNSVVLYDNVLKLLEKMSKLRNKRKISEYVTESEKIIKLYESYKKIFSNFYAKHVKEFLEKEHLFPKEVKKPVESKPLPSFAPSSMPSSFIGSEKPSFYYPKIDFTQISQPSVPKSEIAPSMPTIQPVETKTVSEPTSEITAPPSSEPVSSSTVSAPKVEEPKVELPEPTVQPPKQPTVTKKKMIPTIPVGLGPKKKDTAKADDGLEFLPDDFVKMLEVFANANESPEFIAKKILKYANKIQNINPKLTIKLLDLAEQVIGE